MCLEICKDVCATDDATKTVSDWKEVWAKKKTGTFYDIWDRDTCGHTETTAYIYLYLYLYIHIAILILFVCAFCALWLYLNECFGGNT